MIMSAGLRKLTLAVHLTLSVGWIGAVAAYVALDVATATSRDAQALRTAYLGMDLISRNVIVPLAIASLVTGLVISLGTKWGLFRFYWVVISLVLTTLATVVLLIERGVIASLADVAADPGTTARDLRALSSTLPHSAGGAIVLVIVLVLNIYKPQGLTRYGWRKQQRELQERTRRTSDVTRMTVSMATPREGTTAEPARRPESDLVPPHTEPRRSATGARRWLIVVSIIAAIAVLALLVVLHLNGAFGPGAH